MGKDPATTAIEIGCGDQDITWVTEYQKDHDEQHRKGQKMIDADGKETGIAINILRLMTST